MTTQDHPAKRADLHQGYRTLNKAIPDQMKGLGDLHRSAVADGALSAATKELMAVAIAIATQCEDCMTLHLHDALRAGATREQVHETIGVALLMGGGPASTYATHTIRALEQFDT